MEERWREEEAWLRLVNASLMHRNLENQVKREKEGKKK